MNEVGSSSEWIYDRAFDRNFDLISRDRQEKLRNARVAIAGLGGVGGIYATTLARLGIGHFSIADPDAFEVANTNRQQGATTSTMGASKAAVMERMIKDINPTAEVRVFSALTPENAEKFLQNCALACDGIDFFSPLIHRLLYRECRSRGIPVLNAAPVGFGSSMTNFSPTGMSFDEYFDLKDGLSEQEQLIRFAIGVAPRLLQYPYFPPKGIDLTGHRAPSTVVGTLACAALIGCEAYKVIIGLPYESAPVSWQFDPFVRKFRRTRLRGGNRNIIQRIKKWYLARMVR
ncbi:ThiF family adenylyltransferase [Patescibacteria group bacterium]|nr:ThiF family adenylyltransferase [Patescibacteria group bacterium]